MLVGMRGTTGHPQPGNPCFGAAVWCTDIGLMPLLWLYLLAWKEGLLVQKQSGCDPHLQQN